MRTYQNNLEEKGEEKLAQYTQKNPRMIIQGYQRPLGQIKSDIKIESMISFHQIHACGVVILKMFPDTGVCVTVISCLHEELWFVPLSMVNQTKHGLH